MRQMIMLVLLVFVLTVPVSAMDFQPPEAPDRVQEVVSDSADDLATGLWNVFRWALSQADESLPQAMSCCLTTACMVLLCVLIGDLSASVSRNVLALSSVAVVASTLLGPSKALIGLGIETAQELSEYGKLLLPVMTGALAAGGGVTKSAAVYAASAAFNSILSAFLTRLTVPMLYLYLTLAIGSAALGSPLLEKLKTGIHWCASWILKLVLYLFSGYLSITGIVTGTADASAVRAARIAISGAVPVVGGILSDASEAVMISAGALGSAAGIYGMITVLALFAGPFLRIGVQYLLLKATAAFCVSLDNGGGSALVADFAGALGLLLGAVSTQTVLLLISTLCFMKGVS